MAAASPSPLRAATPQRHRQVQDYQYRVHPHSYQWYSRSVNPRYKHIHRLDDATRYDCSTFNVSHYQDYPNRAGTPKKSPGRRRNSSKKAITSVSVGQDALKKLVSGLSFSSIEVRERLAAQVREAPLRLKTAGPLIAKVAGGRVSAVMNDFHVRETNPGFARNKMGGFYTR